MRILLTILCLAACSPEPASLQPAATEQRPARPAAPASLGGEWRLVEMNGRRPGDAGEPVVPITMTVGDFTFRARSQCVAFWRRYERREDRLIVSPLNPGAMCARGLSRWETEFDRTLSAVTTASRADGVLNLQGPGSELTFETAPPPPRESFTGRWRLRTLHGAPVAEGVQPLEITVTQDRITANACVFAGWRYRQDGQLLEVTPLEEPVCERTLTELEKRFSAFMAGLDRATIVQGGNLILDSAAEQIEFSRID